MKEDLLSKRLRYFFGLYKIQMKNTLPIQKKKKKKKKKRGSDEGSQVIIRPTGTRTLCDQQWVHEPSHRATAACSNISNRNKMVKIVFMFLIMFCVFSSQSKNINKLSTYSRNTLLYNRNNNYNTKVSTTYLLFFFLFSF
jgi:hypothetical protein